MTILNGRTTENRPDATLLTPRTQYWIDRDDSVLVASATVWHRIVSEYGFSNHRDEKMECRRCRAVPVREYHQE